MVGTLRFANSTSRRVVHDSSLRTRHHLPTVFDPHGEERVARLEPCRPQTGLHPSRRARCALLRMRSGMCDLVCDCPTGKSLKTCPPLARKIIRFAFTPNQPYNSRHPAPTRGAYRDRHGRWVRGAVAAKRRARKVCLRRMGRAKRLGENFSHPNPDAVRFCL